MSPFLLRALPALACALLATSAPAQVSRNCHPSVVNIYGDWWGDDGLKYHLRRDLVGRPGQFWMTTYVPNPRPADKRLVTGNMHGMRDGDIIEGEFNYMIGGRHFDDRLRMQILDQNRMQRVLGGTSRQSLTHPRRYPLRFLNRSVICP